MQKRQLVAEQWNLFAKTVLHKDAGAIQRMEMRRAFYAGAQCILFRVIANLPPESEPTDADIEIMQGIIDELSEFADMVKQGRA